MKKMITAAVLTAAATGLALAGTGTASAAPSGARYANCSEARAAGAAPIYQGQPGYSSKLDRDGDGVACETGTSSPAPRSVPTPAPAPRSAVPVTVAPDTAQSAPAAVSTPEINGSAGSSELSLGSLALGSAAVGSAVLPLLPLLLVGSAA